MKYCFALDLIDDPYLIGDYEYWHQHVWPEITQSIREAGILQLEIYRVFNRLFMIMETDSSFSFDRKKEMDEQNEMVQTWEKVMWNFQQKLPGAAEGEKWVRMNKIFDLRNA